MSKHDEMIFLLLQRYTAHKSVRAADVPKADEYYTKLKEGVIG